MTLIKSISGIRGTIGGKTSDGLTPLDVVLFTSAFGQWVKNTSGKKNPTLVIGRDARISGEMVTRLCVGALQGMGINIVDLGLSTTPTVEVAVPLEKADGGIILTASHNPIQWNALKLLNAKGEFISGEDGAKVLEIAEKKDFQFAEVLELGRYKQDESYLQKHIEAILALPLVNTKLIAQANFHIAVDAVNSSGGIYVPALLEALGVKKITRLFCEPTGHFPHNPEPLPEHLTEISSVIKKEKADLGIVVDPDVDRLALVCENGEMFGEEYTLVAVADYVLKNKKGNTVSNLSSTRALGDVTRAHGAEYFAAAVGEVNVVQKMKKHNAVIGGEGNGGIIYPELHYGRDALVGIALFLTHLAQSGKTASQLRESYPPYFMSKNKIELTPGINVDQVLEKVQHKFSNEKVNTEDGVKIDFQEGWVHLRKSNTEPIIRIYSEGKSPESAQQLAGKFVTEIGTLLKA